MPWDPVPGLILSLVVGSLLFGLGYVLDDSGAMSAFVAVVAGVLIFIYSVAIGVELGVKRALNGTRLH